MTQGREALPTSLPQVGLASFLGALHLFNHSCLPNAAFDSKPMRGGVVSAGAKLNVTLPSHGPSHGDPKAPIGRPIEGSAGLEVGSHSEAIGGKPRSDAGYDGGFEFAGFGFRAIVDIHPGDEICHCCACTARALACVHAASCLHDPTELD